MRHGKSAFLALAILAGLAGSAPAQQFGVAGLGVNSFGGNGGLAGNGFNGFGAYNGGYNNFGYNNYNNYGYYRNYNYNYPQTYNNMGGLIGTIRTQTGGGNSYRYGYGPAVGGRRR